MRCECRKCRMRRGESFQDAPSRYSHEERNYAIEGFDFKFNEFGHIVPINR